MMPDVNALGGREASRPLLSSLLVLPPLLFFSSLALTGRATHATRAAAINGRATRQMQP
jgi:hypothetical protein